MKPANWSASSVSPHPVSTVHATAWGALILGRRSPGVLRLREPLHEADVTKFADIVDAKVREYFADTNLKRIRTLYGCTQAELAKRSNVSLRSIQMYEQRNKDINKASAETVLSLAKVLGCTMEDLLET